MTFGHLWTEENDVLDETIFFDRGIYAGMCPSHCNQLFDRLWNVPRFDLKFGQLIDGILDTTFTQEFFEKRIEDVLSRAAFDIVADSRKRSENDEYLKRVEEIRTFVERRTAFLKSR